MEWVPDIVLTISSRFIDQGKKIYLVGGCVQNSLLGRGVDDYDLTTDASSSEVIQLLAEVGIGSVFTLSREFSIIGFAE